jgi:hypothetical protein
MLLVLTANKNERNKMKMIKSKKWLAVYATALLATMAFCAAADQPAAARPENHYTGTVVSVDPNDHTLTARRFVFSKKFNLGGACTYALLDKAPGTASDLRPGEKVVVSYQNAQGVLIADRVEQRPMRVEGMVKSIDPAARTMTLHGQMLDKTLQIANGCNVVLRNEKPGTLNDIQVGNHVTVTYETPGSVLTARQIAQTSTTFAGTLTAIDLDERTVKAKSFLTTMKFNLADHCAIVINGKPDGRLNDLKPDERLAFSYDEINGINVANRIAKAPAEETQPVNSVATTSPTSAY